jgi:hypothetical protein
MKHIHQSIKYNNILPLNAIIRFLFFLSGAQGLAAQVWYPAGVREKCNLKFHLAYVIQQ